MQRKGLMQPETPVEDMEEPMPGAEEGAGEELGEGELDGEAASPAEEQQLEALLGPVMDLVHGNGAKATLEKLKAGREDLAGTIGEMVAQMLISVEQKVAKGGGKIADSVKVEVGQEVIVDLIEICAAAGLVEETEEAKGALLKESMLNALGAYGDMAAQAGMIDRGAARQQLGQMVQGAQDPISRNVAAMLQQGGGGAA